MRTVVLEKKQLLLETIEKNERKLEQPTRIFQTHTLKLQIVTFLGLIR